MKIPRQFLLLATLLLFFVNAEATHLMGGEITYKWISGNTYALELSLYRDCSGIAVSNYRTIIVSSVSTVHSISLTVNLDSTTYTNEICPASSGNTFCNGGGLFGYQKDVYSAQITLPASASDWRFSISECCRNGAISNILDPLNSSFYLETSLDNSNGPNNSPQFSSQPVIIIHAGETQVLSWNAFDSDGDVLEYKLIEPLGSTVDTIVYENGFSPAQPFTAFLPTEFDSLTGLMEVSPSVQQVVVVSMIITEKRQGVIIGSIRRDLQMVVISGSSNHAPQLTGFNGSSDFVMDLVADSAATFNMMSADTDAGQQLSLEWDSALLQLGAVITPVNSGLHPGISISWTPGLIALMRSPIIFTITVRDDYCPYNSVQNFTYTLNILRTANLLLDAGADISTCGTDTVQLNPNVMGGIPPFTYHWLPTQGLNDANLLNPLAAVMNPITYYLTVTDSSGNVATDSVNVNVNPAVYIDSLSGSNVSCFGESNGSACCFASGGTAAYTYLWSDGTAFSCLIGASAAAYTVTVSDANACSATAWTLISEPLLLSIDSVVAGNVFCYGDTTGSICIYLSGGTPVLSQGYHFTWSPYLGPQGVNTYCCVQNLGADSYAVTVSDGHNCVVSASAIVSQPPLFEAQVFSDGGGSTPDTLSAAVAGGIVPFTYQWYFNNSPILGAYAETHIARRTGNYKIEVTDSSGCRALSADTFIQLFCSAHYTLYPDSTTPHHWFALDQAVGNAPINYLWFWGDGDSSTGPTASHIYSAPGNYNICLRISDGTFCNSEYCDSSTYVYKTESDMISVNVVSELPSEVTASAADRALHIYPNPAADFLFIESGSLIRQIELIDMSGKVYIRQISAKNQAVVNLNSLAPGIYFCRITLTDDFAIRKFIRE